MTALLHAVEPLFELAGLLLLLLFFAWAFVTLGLLADSQYLLQSSGTNFPHLRQNRPAPTGIKPTRASNQLTRAA